MSAYAVRRIALALAVFATSVSAVMGQHRTWADSTGKFSVEAELAEIKQDSVVLKKTNGSTVTVPLARLSDADREDLKMQLRLNRDLQVRGSAVAQLVSIALDDQCCDLVRMILNAPRIEVQQCDQLLALLAEHEAKAIDAFVEGNRAEYIPCRQALHDLQHRTGDFDPQFMRDEWGIDGDVTSPLACIKLFTDLGGYSPQKLAEIVARLKGSLLPGAWRGGKMLSDEDYAREVDTLNHFFASILTLAEQPSFRMTRDVKAALAPLYKPLSETTLAGFLIPAEEPMFEAIRRGEASLRGTQCLVALKRWQLQHADAPPDLLTLVKAADLPRVPIDPYSDQPLRMGSVAGKTVIYSVGPDGKDDKAQVEWNLARKQPGDFIFRLETPPH